MTPTTKLEAVNIILTSIGESPVNSLSSGLVDAEMAETVLDAVNRDVQSQGWHFNTENEITLTPDISTGYTYLPANCLRLDMSKDSADKDLVQRGAKLYDRKNHTYDIKNKVSVDMVVLLPFEDIPESARRLINLRAARIFQDRAVGSTELHGFQERDEMLALVELKDAEADTADHNVFDNYDVYRVLDRGIN